MPVTQSKVLLRKPADDSAARLFCFPYSGAGASMYNRWPSRIGSVELCFVQPPGRENRISEPHYGTYESLAEDLVETLSPYFDRPFAFFGHCGGALPGFALALELHRRGLTTPDCLFVSSQVAPHDGPFGRFLHLTNAELAVELTTFAQRLGGHPIPDMISMGLRVLRADIDANKAYHLSRPVVLPSAIRVIGWRDDIEIRPEQLTGWSAYTGHDTYHEAVLDGDHHSFLDAPPQLLAELGTGIVGSMPAVLGHAPTAVERSE